MNPALQDGLVEAKVLPVAVAQSHSRSGQCMLLMVLSIPLVIASQTGGRD